jgi:hypothetical protein
MDDLVKRAAGSVAAAYAAVLDLGAEPPPALVVPVYFDGDAAYQLAPPPLTWDPRHGEGEELATPDVESDPDVLALLERLNGDEYEDLMEPYLAELGLQLHKRLGVLVLVTGVDSSFGAPAREQLLAQMTPEQVAEWTKKDWLPRNRQVDVALESLDVLFSERIDFDRVAAVYRRDGILFGDARLTGTKFGRELREPVMQLGDKPCVVAGLLPAGAVSASVQDLFDVWHDAYAGGGAWLCVLPHDARGGFPPVVFRGAAGLEIGLTPRSEAEPLAVTEIAVPEGWEPDPDWAENLATEQLRALRSTRAPILWPDGAPRPPRLRGWGADSVELELDTLSVEVDQRDLQFDVPLDEARKRIERRLHELGKRTAARAAVEAVARSLPGTVGKRSVVFECAAAGGWWSAAWMRGDLGVVVVGQGEPPERLDLERLRPDDVDLRVN